MERQWHKEHAGEGLIGDWGRGTHIKYDAHVCDFGRVKAQRLIERGRPLPSQKEGIPGGWHAGGRGLRSAAAHAAACK